MQDNKFNLGNILKSKKHGTTYKVIFSGYVERVGQWNLLEIIKYKGGHRSLGVNLPQFCLGLDVDYDMNKLYTWGNKDIIADYFEQASVKYTELAEFMYPDGYRDGDRWVIV